MQPFCQENTNQQRLVHKNEVTVTSKHTLLPETV